MVALKVAEEPKGRTMQRMKLASSLILTASTLVLSIQGCNPGSTLQQLPDQGGNQGGAGDTSVGGDTGVGTNGGTTGLPPATGGTTPVGPGTGGAPVVDNTGGSPMVATGGRVGGNTGGRQPTGGKAPATGGKGAATGGDNPGLPTGGDNAGLPTGGSGVITNPTGGTPATGATGGAASNPTDCKLAAAPGPLTVNGVAYVVDGTCQGYGFAFASKSSGDATATAPSISPCTDKSGCTVTTFADTNKLCATSGTVPPSSDYGATAGIGFALNQTAAGTKGTMMPTGTGLQISFTVGTKPAVLRAQIGDNSATPVSYCFDISAATSPVQIAWAKFNTTCWDTTATGSKAFSTTTPISQVQLIVPGDGTGAAPAGTTRTFTNLCLTGVSTY
jgi:hypothetical protein